MWAATPYMAVSQYLQHQYYKSQLDQSGVTVNEVEVLLLWGSRNKPFLHVAVIYLYKYTKLAVMLIWEVDPYWHVFHSIGGGWWSEEQNRQARSSACRAVCEESDSHRQQKPCCHLIPPGLHTVHTSSARQGRAQVHSSGRDQSGGQWRNHQGMENSRL